MKFNVKRTLLVGLAFMSISCFWQMYDNIIPLILKNSFSMPELPVGIIMALDNVLALFLLPLFGVLSDKVNTRMGKRMPFIMFGTAASVIFIGLMPFADNHRSLWLFILATAGVLLCMSTFRSPAVALMPDVTPPEHRSRGNAIINLTGTIGAIFALIMIKLVVGEGDTPDYTMLFVTIIAFMAVSTILLGIFVPENKWANEMRKSLKGDEEEEDNANAGVKLPKDKQRSLIFMLLSVSFWYMAYNAVTTAFSRYASEVWQMDNGDYASYLMIATVAAVISYIPIGIISGKAGRKKVILTGVAVLAASFIVAGFFTKGGLLVKVIFAIIGVAWASINVNSFPMVVDIASDGDLGKYTGYYYTFSMAAQILTPILSGALLQYVSYRVLFPYGALFTILAFITMTQVRHGDTVKKKPKSLLEHLDVDD